MHASLDYRRWAFESAALDLALRQAGATLGEVVGREPAPLRFVVSTRHDVRDWLAVAPELEFKVDPIPGEWDVAHMDALAATGRVRVCDLKAHYVGTPVDTVPDADFHRLIAEHFPDAVIEDASLAADVLEALDGALDRLSFDAPIHSLADVDALPMRVRHLNIKPSRFGPLSRLFECIDASLERGVELYGGGQFELGVGRGQIQEIASLFYPGTPNDVAPPAYNAPEPVAGLPQSPLPPPPRRAGFGCVIAVALAAAALVVAPPKPAIVQKPIPFGPQRRAEMAAYSKRHYGTAQWRLIAPKVIVEHYTASDTFASAYNTFASDHADSELHELPNVCAHFVIDTTGRSTSSCH